MGAGGAGGCGGVRGTMWPGPKENRIHEIYKMSAISMIDGANYVIKQKTQSF